VKQDHLHCAPCPYYKRGYVQGEGPLDSKLLFIGEAPGQDESFRSHRPFTGPAGMELDRFLKAIHISREDIYLTNLVKCNPPGNEDPVPEVIKRCSHYLEQEIVQVQPSTIVTVGGVALHYFLPNTNLEMIWGIPQELNHSWVSQLFPLYHPALGLHQIRMLPMIEEGFNRLGLWLSGNPIWEEDTVKTVYLKLPKAESSWNTFYNIAVDTETTWDGHPLYIQMSGVEGVAMLAEGKMEGLKEILERSDLTVLMHNSMFDLGVLHKLDIHPSRVVDTMVMAYLLGDLPQGLKALAYRLCGMEMRDYQEVVGDRGQDKAKEYLELAAIIPWPDPPHVLEFKDGEPHVRKPQNITKKILRALKDAEKGTVDLQERWGKMEGREEVEGEMGVMPGADLRDVPEDKAIHYACRDADATRRIYPILKRRIKDEGLEGVLEMDMGVIPMVLEMQRVGIKVDPTEMGKVDVLLEHKMMVEEREIQKLLGYHINPGSPPQVAAMMDKEGIEVKKRRGKSGQQSTGKEFLAPLRKIYPVIDHIMMWSSYETLRSTFTNVLPNLIGTDGRIHTTIKVTRTSTGRLAMENPSLQNIPVRSEEGRMIRDAFIASLGYTLLSFDYSQIELRILAHMSRDVGMINAFLSGYDLHTATASEMFGIPMDQVGDYEHRRPAKTVNFGIPYGITAMGLMDTMNTEGAQGWTEDSCQDLINRWFRARPGVDDFMEECKAHARRYGYITDMFGRRRWTPEVHSSSKKIVEEGLRYAMNQPIQSGAQGVIKLAMARIWKELLPYVEPGVVRPLLQIHDDLLFEVREKEAGWVIPVIQGMMEGVVKLSIPAPVDPKVGERWGSMKKVISN